jgi:hypothetical protein
MQQATVYDDFDHLIDRCAEKYEETDKIRWNTYAEMLRIMRDMLPQENKA